MAMWVGCDGGEDPVDPTVETLTPVAGLAGALLSITGTGAEDVYAIGSDPDGTGATVLHYDGAAWADVEVGAGDLWWGWPSPGGDVFMVGAGSRVVRYTPSTTAYNELFLDPDGRFTLFGVWGAADDDVYAVGGNINASQYGAVVFHFDGTAWTRVELPDAAARQVAMYKVWGRAADDVWVCGNGGTLLHYDGAAWTALTTPVGTSLFTCSGTDDGTLYTVGGAGNGAILRTDASGVTVDESPAFAQTIQGITVHEGEPLAVGWGGVWYGRTGAEDAQTDDDPFTSVWEAESAPLSTQDFHAAWSDGEGGVWAVGGAIRSVPLSQGTVVYRGPNAITPR
jgi:hypothetical protein